jgi:DNA repair protein RecO (recombination protein O)
MSSLTTPAIILRRVEYGDYDLILSFLTLKEGKCSAIAKAARKSTKRFGGVLELFSSLDIVCSSSRRNGLLILQEAALNNPYSGIRADIIRTAYASYWAELIDKSSEDGQRLPELYRLLQFCLCQLDQNQLLPASLSVLFQIRLLVHSGYRPNLRYCRNCRRSVDESDTKIFQFEMAHGGLLCQHCDIAESGALILSKSTLKQMHWIDSGSIYKAGRVRLSGTAIRESLTMLEAFVPYQFGKEPRSLKFLLQVRGDLKS